MSRRTEAVKGKASPPALRSLTPQLAAPYMADARLLRSAAKKIHLL